jgi:methylated-DNA-[protein]-cysteine S-methyltransferase
MESAMTATMTEYMKTFYDHYDTPLGKMEITASESAVLAIHFVDKVRAPQANAITDITKHQMLQYFNGERSSFDLPTAAQGTDFQKQVWQALTTVTYGNTCSYGDIANKINNPKAVRAVGSANGKNPLTIVVPCHRVIGSNGSLTGYASGIDRKAWLLEHELQP